MNGWSSWSMICQTTDDQHKRSQSNEQTNQGKPRASNTFKTNLHTNDKIKKEIDYFIVDPDMESKSVASVETTFKIHNGYSNVLMGIGYFKGTFPLQVKDNAKPYQALPRHIAYALKEPFKKR